jgi:hypothetical protein
MPETGLPVFLDYDQAALDSAYDQAAYAANREQLIERRIRDSANVRGRIGEPERVAYGPPRSSGSISAAASAPRLPSLSSFMVAPGAAAVRRISRGRPRCSSPPGRITSCATSSG